MKKVLNLFAIVLGLAIVILGLAGVGMGSGYLVNGVKPQTGEGPDDYLQRRSREEKTGWASVGAGIAVATAGPAVAAIIIGLYSKLDQLLRS